jgi:2,3,4,5-tetrahydropyridine-2,6-dicarboxylate N-succinyltransferase
LAKTKALPDGFCQAEIKRRAGGLILKEQDVMLQKKIIFAQILKEMMTEIQSIIEKAWENRALLQEETTTSTIRKVIDLLDQGKLRVAEPTENGWLVNEWVKKAVVMYFPIQKMETWETGIFEYHDKMLLKTGYAEKGIRVVPPAVARFGAYISKGVILMPSYVNIGAYVDEGTMVDTWATVGSCAQIGKDVHLSGGVGIGGVLEPLQAAPVIIEDGAFIGSRCSCGKRSGIGCECVFDGFDQNY